jgi:hypothetical protein
MTLSDINKTVELMNKLPQPQKINVAGEDCYVMTISHTFAEMLKAEDTPKRRWKWKEHIRRWEKHYGRPYVMPVGEVHEFKGMTILQTETAFKPPQKHR